MKSTSKLTLLVPTFGIILFALLYGYAASLYPGGSQANEHSIGFSWVHNYWCNLLNTQSINGQANHAQPIATTAMAVLCFSLMLFFIQFAQQVVQSLFWKRVISLGGIVTMFSAFFISFPQIHDLMTILSSLSGVFVVIGLIKTIYQYAKPIYKFSGLGCILLLGLNNAIYYSSYGLYYLPLLQKVTFAFVLLWIIGLNLEMVRKK